MLSDEKRIDAIDDDVLLVFSVFVWPLLFAAEMYREIGFFLSDFRISLRNRTIVSFILLFGFGELFRCSSDERPGPRLQSGTAVGRVVGTGALRGPIRM